MTEGIELPNQDKIRTPEEMETYKYMGILEADTIKHVEMKEKIKERYPRRTRKLDYIPEISPKEYIWGVTLVRYSGPFLNWMREKF